MQKKDPFLKNNAKVTGQVTGVSTPPVPKDFKLFGHYKKRKNNKKYIFT